MPGVVVDTTVLISGFIILVCEASGTLRSAGDLGGDAGAVVALGEGEIVAGLEVEPELGAGAEMAREAQRGVRADRALAVEDRRDPPRGHTQRERQPVGRHAARRELTPQDATRVDRDHRN